MTRRSSPHGVTLTNRNPMARRQLVQRRQCGDAAARADQPRRDVEQELVDQIGVDQRSIELLAGFDVQLVDTALRQVGQHGMQVDLAVGACAARSFDAAFAPARRRARTVRARRSARRPAHRRPAPMAASRNCESTTRAAAGPRWARAARRAAGCRPARCPSRSARRPHGGARRARRCAQRAGDPMAGPSASAVRPSSETATFRRTHGRLRRMREKKPMLSSRASSAV